MAKVTLASALARWLPPEARPKRSQLSLEIPGATLGEVLDGLFVQHPVLRGYVVDERGQVRHHVALFVDGEAVLDKRNLTQPLPEGARVHVMQALSGG